jgi:hypothetical protein
MQLNLMIFSDERNGQNNTVISGSVTHLYALLTYWKSRCNFTSNLPYTQKIIIAAIRLLNARRAERNPYVSYSEALKG